MLCCRPSKRQKPSENRKSFGLVVALNSFIPMKGSGVGAWAETSGLGGFWCAGRHLVAFGLQFNVTPFDRELRIVFLMSWLSCTNGQSLEVKP